MLFPPTKQIVYEPSLIQNKAWQFLIDSTTNVILFGGAAGAGKSDLICVFTTIMCIQYPGIAVGLTRARIIDLRKSTLITLMNVFKRFGIRENINYTFDRQINIITFWNGSKIIMFDSALYPSDPLYERLSSIELTFACADECSQLTKTCFDIIQSRVRYRHSEFNLIPKILFATNPTNNFIRSEIYDPYINGTLPKHMGVVLGRAIDNKYIDKSYIENLEKLHPAIRERLLYGNWNYETIEDSIFDPEKLVNVFYNYQFVNINSNKYLTCDPASTGGDKTAITIWCGLECIKVELLNHKTIPQVYDRIVYLMGEYKIPIQNVAVDKSGIGTGLSDMLKGSMVYIANAKPTNIIYGMLKDELYYMMADYINNDRVKFSFNYLKDEIVQEFGAHVMFNYDKDNTKTQILPKDKVKASIGRSPDIADSLILRMMWEVKKSKVSISFL